MIMYSNNKIDLSNSRSPHSFGNKLYRVVWACVWLLLFRPSPKIFHFWRRALLRIFGAEIGKKVNIHPSVRIWAPVNLVMKDFSCLASGVDCYCVDKITIGEHATVSQYCYLCAATHDYEHVEMPLISAPIKIGTQAWVTACVFIGPGVEIGEGAVVGATSTVVKNIPPWSVAVGNPAKVIKKREIMRGE